jgi:hypothetical protein
MGAVWIADYTGTIYRIHPVTHEVSRLDVGSPVAAIGVDAATSSLWIAIANRGKLPL